MILSLVLPMMVLEEPAGIHIGLCRSPMVTRPANPPKLFGLDRRFFLKIGSVLVFSA